MHKNNDRLNAVLRAGNVHSQSTRTGELFGIPDQGYVSGARELLSNVMGGSKESKESAPPTTGDATEAVDNSGEILRIYNNFISAREDRVKQLNEKREEAEKCANILKMEVEKKQKADIECAATRKAAVDKYLEDQSVASKEALTELKDKLTAQKVLLDSLLKAKGNASNENDAKIKALQDQLDATKVARADEIEKLTQAADLKLQQAINASESAANVAEESVAERVRGYVEGIAEAKAEALSNENKLLALQEKCYAEQTENAEKVNKQQETVAERAALTVKSTTINDAIDALCKLRGSKE